MASGSSETTFKKGSTKHCCWGNCNNGSKYPDKLPSGGYFIRLPKPGNVKESMTQWKKYRENVKTEKAKKWVHACGRGFSIKNIKKDIFIYSNHFIGGCGPTEENSDPLFVTLADKELKKKATRKRKPPKQRELIPPKATKRKSENMTPNAESTDTVETTDTNDIVLENSADYVDIYTNDAATNTEIYVCDITTLTGPDMLAIAGRIDNVSLKNELSLIKNSENIPMYRSQNSVDMNVILKFEKDTKYFIGLTPRHFRSLYKFLGDVKFSLSYWKNTKKQDFTGRNSTLSVAEQLFITLLRLRCGFNIVTLAYFSQVSEYTIRTIFTTWIMFLFKDFQTMKFMIFPERQAYRKTLPKVFRPFKNIRASIDCTEFKCEMPRNYSQQGNFYSSYKSDCTMKCLIAVNPNGAACFVSDLFEGSISDVDIFE